MVAGAIRTDFILSAEIMAIALAEARRRAGRCRRCSAAQSWRWSRVAITVGVYGAVGLIVKMDDIGLHLAEARRSAARRALGRGLVHAMPKLLAALALIGTAAMLWVGGQIIVHGLGPASGRLGRRRMAASPAGPRTRGISGVYRPRDRRRRSSPLHHAFARAARRPSLRRRDASLSRKSLARRRVFGYGFADVPAVPARRPFRALPGAVVLTGDWARESV